MKLADNPSECCGCGVCAASCPNGAIDMKADEKGFLYPEVSVDKCINCGLCLKKCDFKKEHDREDHILAVYAMQHESKQIVKSSSSGGAFTAVSDFILSVSGTVYGAVLDSVTFEVHHIRADSTVQRNKMRGSKYVQSKMGDVFTSVKCDLDNGKIVLFTGMPCQCAALVSYMNGHPDNLYIVDLLCHGVPSNRLLQDHIGMWEKKSGKKVIDYWYRSKKYGYEHTHEIVFADGSSNSSIDLKRLLKLYEHSMRPSCHHCPYTSKNRVGDLTIGDLWDSGVAAGVYDHRGTSTVIVNTQKGMDLSEHIRDANLFIKLSKDTLKQDALSAPVPISSKSESLWTDYKEYGYKYVLNKYAPYTVLSWGYATMWRTLFYTHLDRLVVYLISKKNEK